MHLVVKTKTKTKNKKTKNKKKNHEIVRHFTPISSISMGGGGVKKQRCFGRHFKRILFFSFQQHIKCRPIHDLL